MVRLIHSGGRSWLHARRALRPAAALWLAGAAVAAGLGLTAPASANDSTAELATGGLRLVQDPDIRMDSEDLFLSTKEIRVRYVFHNTSDQPKTVLVAFPLPPLAAATDGGIAPAMPNWTSETNFLDFSTEVDGKPVEMSLQEKATVLGIDQTDLLKSLGVPLNPNGKATSDALEKVPTDRWKELEERGLVQVWPGSSDSPGELHQQWTLEATYYWQQTFPPNQDVVVTHRYKPSVGLTSGITFEQQPEAGDYARRFCTDKAFLGGVAKMQAEWQRTQKEGLYPVEARLDYILKTGANWEGTIGNFRLVIDKGAPTGLVSTCLSGLRKIGPTQFELVRKDFEPTGDIALLFVLPISAVQE